jgi:predicted dehydrogenase
MHRLLFLDPGHFHAALTLRAPHPRVADDIVVYAPDGPERRDFLALVERFNARGTRWRVDVVTTDEPLTRLIDERRGDVVVLAGKNGGKARTMRRLHDTGFHVLADKPWLVEPEDLDDVRASLADWPLVTEIMTGRHDVAARVLKLVVDTIDVTALEMESVHHLEKLVDGAPLRRPWWFFDVRVQGSGVVDIPTHLVDRAQWLTERVTPNATPELVSVRASPTLVPLAAFRRITGERDVPAALAPLVDGDALRYLCNAELELRLGAVTARASARWALAAPDGGGDSSLLVARGAHAVVRLEQSARTGHRRQLLVDTHDARAARAVDDVVAASQAALPGLHVNRIDARRCEVVIPADGGHEAHFALVLDQFLRTIDDGPWPADVAARTAAKYAVLADAAGRVLSETRARSPR